jgi:hypothetical protein
LSPTLAWRRCIPWFGLNPLIGPRAARRGGGFGTSTTNPPQRFSPGCDKAWKGPLLGHIPTLQLEKYANSIEGGGVHKWTPPQGVRYPHLHVCPVDGTIGTVTGTETKNGNGVLKRKWDQTEMETGTGTVRLRRRTYSIPGAREPNFIVNSESIWT